MKRQFRVKQLFLITILSILGSASFGQKTTVTGTVIDSITKMPIQNVSVFFKGRNGTVTDANGKYQIQTIYSVSTIQFSYVGLKTVSFAVAKGKTQEINAQLAPDASLSNITVNSNRRIKYTNRNNPAVELIRKVIDNKSKNRTQAYSFVQYDQYEKLQLSLNKVPEKIASGKALKKYKFLLKTQILPKLKAGHYCPFI